MVTRACPVLLPFLLLACSSAPSPPVDQKGPADVGAPEAGLSDRAPGVEGGRTDLGRTARCLMLVEQYRKLLREAKVCALQAGQPQCQKLVDAWVACGCLTAVEASHEQTLAAMAELARAWTSLGCQMTCPGGQCKAPLTGICAPNGGLHCADQN